MSKNWISFPRIEGQASRQAHADLPEGTYEREIGREGFFGPATHMYHKHMPTAWSSFTGPLRPRAYDTTKFSAFGPSPWSAKPLLGNAQVKVRVWRLTENMHELARNSDGDELLFVHSGSGDLFCDFGHMTFSEGDYIVLPRGTMWRIERREDCTLLMIEAVDSAYQLPDRGMLGEHAQFDPAVLETPKINHRFLMQQGETEWKVALKRRNQISTITYPFNPLDAQGWKGTVVPVKLNWRDIRPIVEPPLSSAAVGAHDVPGRPVRRLHVRAAADRERSGRAEGAVLSQQRRLRRGDLLSRGQFLQPRQHQGRDDHVPSGGLHARAASEGVCGGREVGAQGNRRGRGDDRYARCAGCDAGGGVDRGPIYVESWRGAR